MLPDDPRHGRHAGYVAGCRDECCATAKRREDKRRAILRMHLGSLIVDATRARRHIDYCLAWGVTYEAFVQAGVSNAGMVHRGELPRIHRTTETKLLSVRPMPGVNCFAAHSARRRIQALLAMGHEQATLARELGMQPSYLSMLLSGVRGWQRVDESTWHAIDALFTRLADVPGGSTRSYNRAQREGWVTAAAWDDIDDPAEVPSTHRRHTYRAEELAAEWDFLRRSGLSMEQAAERLGVTKKAIEKALARVSGRAA